MNSRALRQLSTRRGMLPMIGKTLGFCELTPLHEDSLMPDFGLSKPEAMKRRMSGMAINAFDETPDKPLAKPGEVSNEDNDTQHWRCANFGLQRQNYAGWWNVVPSQHPA